MATKRPDIKQMVAADLASRDLPWKEEKKEEMAALREKNMLAQIQAHAQAQPEAHAEVEPEVNTQAETEAHVKVEAETIIQAPAQMKAETLIQVKTEVNTQAETKLLVEKLKSQVDAKRVKFQVGKKQRTIWMTFDTINKIDELCKRTDKSMYEIIEVAVNNLYVEVLKK